MGDRVARSQTDNSFTFSELFGIIFSTFVARARAVGVAQSPLWPFQ